MSSELSTPASIPATIPSAFEIALHVFLSGILGGGLVAVAGVTLVLVDSLTSLPDLSDVKMLIAACMHVSGGGVWSGLLALSARKARWSPLVLATTTVVVGPLVLSAVAWTWSILSGHGPLRAWGAVSGVFTAIREDTSSVIPVLFAISAPFAGVSVLRTKERSAVAQCLAALTGGTLALAAAQIAVPSGGHGAGPQGAPAAAVYILLPTAAVLGLCLSDQCLQRLRARRMARDPGAESSRV